MILGKVTSSGDQIPLNNQLSISNISDFNNIVKNNSLGSNATNSHFSFRKVPITPNQLYGNIKKVVFEDIPYILLHLILKFLP